MKGRPAVGSTSTNEPFGIACVISRSKPEITAKPASAAPWTMIGLTVFKTKAAGTTPRTFISCSIHAVGNATFCRIQHEHTADIALARELMLGA